MPRVTINIASERLARVRGSVRQRLCCDQRRTGIPNGSGTVQAAYAVHEGSTPRAQCTLPRLLVANMKSTRGMLCADSISAAVPCCAMWGTAG